MAGAAGRRAPVHRPRRRLDHRRADRGRPPGDPGAAADRHRRPPGRQHARDRRGRRRARDPAGQASPPAELAKQIQAMAQHPETLATAAHAAWNCGRPKAAERPRRPGRELRRRAELMDVIRVDGGHEQAQRRPRDARGTPRDERRRHRHRHDPLRRHRRDRHVGHRRGDAQPRLQRAGLGHRRGLRRRAAAQARHHGARSATRADNLGDAAVVVTSTAVKRDNPEVAAALESAHSRGPPRRDAGRADAAQAHRRGRRHPRQDHHHLDGRRAARCRRDRPDGDQRRDHRTATAPTPGSAPATGWWSRPTRATAASCGSTARSRWSPTSIPSTSTTTAASTRCKDAFVEFIENVPFYGAAVLCIDHPEVQAVIAKVRDRRVITYGFSAQADVRGESVTPDARAATASTWCSRQRDGSEPADRGHRAADARPPQRPERARRDRRGARDGLRRRHDPHRLRPVRRGRAALHQGRRGRAARR